jgi:hypothetical protein
MVPMSTARSGVMRDFQPMIIKIILVREWRHVYVRHLCIVLVSPSWNANLPIGVFHEFDQENAHMPRPSAFLYCIFRFSGGPCFSPAAGVFSHRGL